MLKGMPFWSRTGLPLAFFAANRRQALPRSEEHTSELQSQSNLVCRLLLEKKKKNLQDLLIYISFLALKLQRLVYSNTMLHVNILLIDDLSLHEHLVASYELLPHNTVSATS